MPFDLLLTTPTGQPTRTLTVPTQWRDVTLAQFVALHAPDPDEQRSAAEVLCGLEAGGFNNLAADDAQYIANLLAFSQGPSDVLALLPTPGLPDIGSLPFGVLLEAQSYVASIPDRPALFYGPYLCALYRVQLAFGKYSEAKVEACLAALLASPVTEAYADCVFFLSSYQRWQHATRQTTRMLPTPTTTKKKRVMNGLRKGSVPFSAWIRRLRGTS